MLDGAAHFYNTYACLDADPDDGKGWVVDPPDNG